MNKCTKAITTECAWCATRTGGAYFSARYHRLAARRRKKRALVAIAAEMPKVICHILKGGTAYQERGSDYMGDKQKQARIEFYREQLNKGVMDIWSFSAYQMSITPIFLLCQYIPAEADG